MRVITFKHAPTLRAACYSDALVKIVQGPVESGKTTWGFGEILRQSYLIPRCTDGVRRARWLVTRQTDAELQRGPIRSFRDWFPTDDWGPIVGSAPAIITLELEDLELYSSFE